MWELERADASLSLVNGSLMIFLPSGELRYAAPASGGGLQVAILTYWIDGDQLVTNQPSAPAEERTGFRFLDYNHLELTYSRGRAGFVRAEQMDSFTYVSRAVNRILFEHWDPLGIREAEGPEDEYRSYVPQLIGRVHRGASDAELAGYLAEVKSRQMGLSVLPSTKRMDVAARIRTAVMERGTANLDASP